MAAPPNVELEAAKFLHKLIQESTDEPTKLARKLYVILQHMRSSGKENSMPYQVISRAMETVINQHSIDMEALNPSRLPLSGVTHMGDSSSTQFAGSSQTAALAKDSKAGMSESEVANSHPSSRPPVGPSGAGHDIYQGSVSRLGTKPLDQESPSSFETRSANSQSQERHDTSNWDKANQNDGKKASSKRKRADSSSTAEPHIDNPQQGDTGNLHARKGKLVNKVEPPGSLSVKGSEHSHFNMVQGSGQMEHIPSLPSSMRSTNITNSISQGANSKFPEEIEVSSSALGLQQGGPRLSTHDILSSRGLWNHNRTGFPLEKSQVSRFPSNAGSGNSTAEILMHQSNAPVGSSASGKVHGAAPGSSGSYPPVEQGIMSPMHFSSASYDNLGLVVNANKERIKEPFSASPSVEHDGGTSNVLANANKMVQSGIPGNIMEMNMLRSAAPRDTGKSPTSLAPGVSNMPFKEQHLKQLRAQCLVFLAFRNGLIPKKLHLEIALGNFLQKEDGPPKELIDHKGKELSISDPNNIPEDTMPFGRLNNVRDTERVARPSSTGLLPEANFSRESEDPNIMGDKNHLPSDLHIQAEERRNLLSTRRKGEAEVLAREISESQAFLTKGSQLESLSVRGLTVSNRKDDLENGQQAGTAYQASSVLGISKQMKTEMINWTGIGIHNEAAKGSAPGSMVLHESVPERKDNAQSQSQILADCNIQGSRHADNHLPSFPSREHWKPISGMEAEHQTVMHVKDASVLMKNVSEDDRKISEIQRRCIPDGCKAVLVDDMQKNGSPAVVETDQEEEEISLCTDLPQSPKYTTLEKWVMEQKKRRFLIEQNWALKQQKTEQKIAACSEKLKETVSSSEDISAKTKSVIELKKLQLLELQRRLRSDILNDFFKPIVTEMDRLKSAKKHRIGRRSKQIERFEQKMKEERQKRIRERQKEFFSEIEVHRERLDDAFKMKRERWKGFNKYIREFHKRKERIHREKIDRIQREKINLLKINDVEGYLRMVQDAKSDRVKQLLKETEKYLQKLGSKLKEAKDVAGHFESDMGENRAGSVLENYEIVENEDEADQAKHYLESNEKYYLMAHSIKESIADQPTCLVGGKLREYQMNGLRWLLSLYNNHLNGILADEMGLGKTVQVIALICYLMETKNDRGPFLVVVPSSVLPGWESELNFWAPSVNKIIYSGPPEERRRLFKERIVQRKFNVLLTTYEYLMNKHDRPKLSKLHWHYIIIDEGHRIKNASCKLNADLKHYISSHRLLLTGTPLQNNLEELWALLNFLLPNIFNSSEDFSQWFNKPFESNGDNSPDQALLSEEENLLIINRLHQVLRPFVLRRLKHKVENQLPEKIERLVRCEASAYQKLLMTRVEDNLGAIGTSKARSVHNSVMELRNICNHPYLSQLHVEEVHDFIPKHYLPSIVRLCGKLEMLDRLLPKLKATDHRVLFFSTMTRLLDVMEDYLCWKQYRYLRLDGHTSGGDRGALIDNFNQPGSPFFIFLLSIRAGGVGVNLQAADTVIIFDTDWNPQVDLQAQARAHRIGQKKDVLVLRLETVQTVEEQVRASAEHKLGVANQSITAGFFDNNTSAEDRREYLESLLRECKKEEAAPVLDDDALNDLIARSESEIDIFESVDRQRREDEMAMWKTVLGQGKDGSGPIPPLPSSRLLTFDELKPFYEAMKISDVSNPRVVSTVGAKRKGESLGGLDTRHYGRGKRAREVRSYEEQWTEEEFEKMCQADSPSESPKLKEEVIERNSPIVASGSITITPKTEPPAPAPAPAPPIVFQQPSVELPMQQTKEATATATATATPTPTATPMPTPTPTPTPPIRRGRGRPKRVTTEISPSAMVRPAPYGTSITDIASQKGTDSSYPVASSSNSLPSSATVKPVTGASPQFGVWIAPSSESTPPLPSVSPGAQPTPPLPSVSPGAQSTPPLPSVSFGSQSTLPLPSVSPGAQSTPTPTTPSPSVVMLTGQTQKTPAPRRRGKKQAPLPPAVPLSPAPGTVKTDMILHTQTISSLPTASCPDSVSGSATVKGVSNEQGVVSPVVPVLPASSETGKMDLGSEVRPVSSNPMVTDPENVSATAIVTDVSGTVHNFGTGIVPSSQPNPPFASDAIGSQSIPPSLSVPKLPKRRGRKPQTGVEAPRCRGRRQGPIAPVAAHGLAGQDPKSNEQSDSKLQVSSGRKSIVTRRMKEIEAAQLSNVIQVQTSELQTSDSLAGPDAKPTGQSDYLAQNNQQKGSSTTSGSAAISSDKIGSQTEKIDAKAKEMKIPVLEEAFVSESVVASVEERVFVSTLGTVAAVVDPEIQKTQKDVDPEIQKTQKDISAETQERNDLILQDAVVSKPEVCEVGTNLNTGSFVNVEDSRDLVEKNSIVQTDVEGTSAVTVNAESMNDVPCEKLAAPDAFVLEMDASVLDVTTDKCEDQSVKEDAEEQELKGSDLDDIVVSEPGDTGSLEEKKISTLSMLETEAPVVDSETEKTPKEVDAEAPESNDPILQEVVASKFEASEPETKINTGSFENVANPIYVVKEGSLVGANVEGTSDVPLNADPLDDVPCENVPDALDSNLTMNKCDDQSGKQDAKEQEMECLVVGDAVVSEPGETKSFGEEKISTTSIFETEASVPEIEKTEKQDAESQESNDLILQDALLKPEACEPDTKLEAVSLENVANPRDVANENLIMGTNVEETTAVTLNADPLEDMLCEKPPAPDASVLEVATSVLDIVMDSEDQSRKEDGNEQEMKDPVLDDVVVSESGATKSLEEKTLSTLETAAAVDPEIEKTDEEVDAEAMESNDDHILQKLEACDPETKINTDSFENMADLRSLVKESSIVGTNVESSPAAPLNADPLDDVPCEKPSSSDISNLELTIDMGEDHGKEDTNEQKLKGPLLDEVIVPELGVSETMSLEEKKFPILSTLEKEAPVVDPETEKPEKEVNAEAQEINDPILQEAVVSKPEACEPETKLETLPPENVTDPRDVAKETVLLNADPSEHVPNERPAPDASVLETAASNLEVTKDVCEDQSVKEDTKEEEMKDTTLDEGIVSEPVVTEFQSSQKERTTSTLETASFTVDHSLEKPETDLNASGSSENEGDSEHFSLNPILSDDGPHEEEPPNVDASVDSSLPGSSSVQMDSTLTSEEEAKESSSAAAAENKSMHTQ